MEAHAGSRHLEILLLHELSAGTFARLYLAEARQPGGIERIVAVKILREQWNESAEVINRTRDEARLLARLRHKNILRVEDLSQIDGQLAIIMEFVDGLDLKQLVEGLSGRRQRVPPRAALQIAAEAAAAIEAAYFKIPTGLDAPLHVVHRDIKPSNVMVSVEGEVKVLDFGTARSSQAFRSVQTGALRFGSLKYMSPERREGDRGEHSADVYALGLMLLEVLRGEWLPLLPMDVQEHDETVADEIARLRDLGMPNREWDVALRQVLLQMMAGEASQRPNAEQVAKLLRAFAEQAAGDNLDTFARETVAPLARQVRGNLTGGALAGTRFVVNHFPSDGQGRGAAAAPRGLSAGARPVDPSASYQAPKPNAAQPASPAPAAAAPARPAAPAHPAPAQPAPARPLAASPTAIPDMPALAGDALRGPAARTFDDDDESPTYAGQPAGVPAPSAPTNLAGPARPQAAGPAPGPAAPTRPAPVSPPAHAAPVVETSAGPARPAGRSGPSTAAIAGVAFGVIALLGIGLVIVGAAAFYLYTSRGAPPAPAVTTGASSGPPVAASVGSEPLAVTMEGAPVQWIRLHTAAGEQVLSGESPLSGKVAPDTYTLSMKQVGRPAIRGTLPVPSGGVSLVCRAEKDNTVSCTGGAAPVPLRP